LPRLQDSPLSCKLTTAGTCPPQVPFFIHISYSIFVIVNHFALLEMPNSFRGWQSGRLQLPEKQQDSVMGSGGSNPSPTTIIGAGHKYILCVFVSCPFMVFKLIICFVYSFFIINTGACLLFPQFNSTYHLINSLIVFSTIFLSASASLSKISLCV
jgi:hypothetical protein